MSSDKEKALRQLVDTMFDEAIQDLVKKAGGADTPLVQRIDRDGTVTTVEMDGTISITKPEKEEDDAAG